MRKGLAKLTAFVLIASLVLSGGSKDAAAAKKVRLNKKKVQLYVGKSVTLKVKNKAKKAKVSWKSANKKIASVSKKGKVTARKAGDTKITAVIKKGKKTKKLVCKVTVRTKRPTPTAPAVSAGPGGVPAVIPSGVTPGTGTPPANVQTQKPQTTYHPNWQSQYADAYVPLKELAKGFKIGAAIAGSREEYAAIYDADMSGILQKHYNTTTLTNLMKPSYLLDEEGSRNSEDGMPAVKFDTCEKELQFCKDTGIQLRGHVLVWYNQTPDWFFYEDYDTSKKLVDKQTMSRRMESYIKQVVTYVQTNYPGVVYCWDVVNEAVGDDGKIRKNGNKWMEVYAQGDKSYSEYDYVKDAFEYARKYVAPGVSLVYNDYNTFEPTKRAEILNMIHTLNQDKKRIDAIGMQCPILPRWPEIRASETTSREQDACVEYAVEDFAAEGLEIMITELCVRTDGGNTEEEMRTQAARYKEMYELFVNMDTDNGGIADITSVTMFGLSDSYRIYSDDTWRPGDESRYAWLFDKSCKAKLAFKCVYNVLAKAAGKDTVPETYEEPDEKPEETKPTHVVSGTLQSKNGVAIPDDFLIFHIKDETFFAMTDKDGKYSVILPEGTCQVYSSYLKETVSFTVSAGDDKEIEKNFELNYDLYRICGVVRAANGTAVTDREIVITLTDEQGDFLNEISAYLGEDGMFETYAPKGKAYPSIAGIEADERCVFDISGDIGKEEAVEITMPYDVYHLRGQVDAQLREMFGKDKNLEIVLRSSTGDNEYLYPEEDGTFDKTVRAGQYALVVNVMDDDESIEHQIYYTNIHITEDTEVSIEKKALHELTITCEPDVGLRFVRGEEYNYPVGEIFYVGNVSDRLHGRHDSYDEDDNYIGTYEYDASFAFTEQDEVSQKLVLEVRPYVFPQLQLGEMTQTTVSEMREEAYYFAYTPEESGTYTFYSASGITQEDEEGDAQSEVLVWNEKRTEPIVESSSEGRELDFTCTAELEAGKTYYVGARLWWAWELEDQPFPIGVKKAE